MTTTTQTVDLDSFIASLVAADVAGCRAAGTDMDAEWTGEHTTALAEHLGCTVAELDDSDITAARKLYEAAAREALQ